MLWIKGKESGKEYRFTGIERWEVEDWLDATLDEFDSCLLMDDADIIAMINDMSDEERDGVEVVS